MQSDILVGMNKLVESQNANIATIIESMKVKETQTAKLVKPAKVPAWTKEMTLVVYLKALEAWMEQNKDMSEHVKFQDVIESLKMNKEVNGLAKYVGKHILPVLDAVEKMGNSSNIERKVLKNKNRRIKRFNDRMVEF